VNAGGTHKAQVRTRAGDDPNVESSAFTFRLERIRSLRERAEEAAREELARELSHRIRGEAMLREATHAAAAARAAGRDTVLASGASGADLLAAQAWMERVERRRHDAVADLDRVDADVARSREALTEAARAREAIERLKRRRRADHESEMQRRSQISLDEIALTVHRRGSAA
jgi:flagellar FliJ protein